METILLDLAEQEGVELLTIRVPYDPILIAAVKKIQGVRWDPDHRVWKVPPRKGLLMELRNSFGENAKLDESELRRKLNLNLLPNSKRNQMTGTLPQKRKKHFPMTRKNISL